MKCKFQRSQPKLKLTPEERLCLTLKGHTIHFCILQLEPNQRSELLKINPNKMLKNYLLWIGQSYFVEMANHVGKHLLEKHFLCLLHIIFLSKNHAELGRLRLHGTT
ncbi:hypothetical protein NPIL_555821 [Nephila pilipes]|uniref:Uncharacterized protein n=1 Tax=Nephila pilipes TaxID=299642 RepID=A0A8X6U1N4_NEPPI|nr:hypothetical protein NPIL_453641 [Nephila pilipes]GFU53113.1 hypothetical protein NPIL_555821 [Nephila pilipes]